MSDFRAGDKADPADASKPAALKAHGLAEALSLTARVLGQVLSGASLDSAMHALQARNAPLRAAVQDLTYNTLRAYGRVDVIAARLLDKPLSDASLKGLVFAALTELASRPHTDYVVVHQAVEAASLLGHARARGLVNAVLRTYQRQAVPLNAQIEQSETGRYGHPQWWIDLLKSTYPSNWREILVAANSHPPMTLRVNRRRMDVDRYLARLEAAGRPGRHLGAAAVMLQRPCPVSAIPGFAEGDVSVQDAGAQRAAVLLDVADGMRVLDACAAPGGKTGHILELAGCSLLALEISGERASRISENLNRLGLAAEGRRGDARHPEAWNTGARRFDRILLDAPCSASGVVRRHPDIRWLRRESDIQGFARTQAQMLEALWPLLERNGKLLYTTCSVFPAENSMQIRAFLDSHDDAERLPTPGIEAGQILPSADSDGFYYALLRRNG